MTRYVFDSFALLAHFRDEPGADHVRRLMSRHEIWMNVVNAGEVYYKTRREQGEERAEEVWLAMQDLALQFAGVDLDAAKEAASIKGKYPISYAGCFAAVLSQELSVAVVTGDPEFRQLEDDGIISVEWLAHARRR